MFNKIHSKKLYYITWTLNTILLAILSYHPFSFMKTIDFISLSPRNSD